MKFKFFLLSLLILFNVNVGFVHANESEKWATVLIAFGTTMPSAEVALYDIGNAYKAQLDENEILLWAYSSDMVRNRLAEQGVDILSVAEAMDEAAARGVTHLRMQSLHVTAGAEFSNVQRIIMKQLTENPDMFESVLLGSPLLESLQDIQDVVQVVLSEFPAERQRHEAIVLMGHGNHTGIGDIMLYAMDRAFKEQDSLVYMAAVEGGMSFDSVLADLQAKGIKTVWLQPFMIVAGDHANNDMAGADIDSWASQINAVGMQAIPHVIGLGQLQGIQEIFIQHTIDTVDDLANSNKQDLQ